MIHNIVFDVGNVLLKFNPLDHLNKSLSNSILAKTLHNEIFCSSEWIQLDAGTITEDEAIDRFCARNPQNQELIREIMKDWYSILTPIEGSVRILHELKERNYRTYVISNYHLKAFDKAYERYDFFKLFDGMIISSRVKCLKPGPEIYSHLTDTYGISSEESLFIDDTIENVDAARRLGFKALQFVSPEEFRRELKSLNIL